jgi:hypothetical protein
MSQETPALPCEGKLRFATQKEANAAATVARHRYGSKLKVYHCLHCGWWHLSSS